MLVEKFTAKREKFALKKKKETGGKNVVLCCTLQLPQGAFVRASTAGPTCKEILRRVTFACSASQLSCGLSSRVNSSPGAEVTSTWSPQSALKQEPSTEELKG